MKTSLLCVTLVLTVPLFGAEKVRVFIDGQGTVNATNHSGGGYDGGLFGHRTDATVDMHNESIELAKDMREHCPELVITLKEDAADYIVKLNRESKAKRGVFDKNTQVLVANKQGDVIWTKDVRQVRSAAKDACSAISSASGLRDGVSTVAKSEETKPEQLPTAQTSFQPPAPTSASKASFQAIASTSHTEGTPGPSSLFDSLGIWVQKAPEVAGVVITAVAAGSAAAEAGLHVGYVINAVNGKPVGTPEELQAATLNYKMEPGFRIGYMFPSQLGWFQKDALLKLHTGN
jgi:hypothetical protein